jgi:hypothetical protein
MRKFSFFTVVIAAFFAVHAQAGKTETAVSAAFQGNWAAPDCGHYEEAMVLTASFFLKSTESETTLWPAYPAGRGADYAVITIAGEDRPAARTEDSLLRLGRLNAPAPKKWPKDWDSLDLNGADEYAGCHDMPALVPLPLVHILAQIDKIAAACAADVTPACRKILFSFVDANKNKKLSPAEFKKAGGLLAVFAALAERHTVPTTDLESAYKQGINDGAVVAGQLLDLRDKNKSGDLDEKELAGFTAELNSAPLQAALKSAGKILPAFTMTALEMPVR